MISTNWKGCQAPCDVRLHVSTLILMDAHAHGSRGEVMGLTGGAAAGRRLTVCAYRRAAAAAGSTHCDMDPGTNAYHKLRLVNVNWDSECTACNVGTR